MMGSAVGLSLDSIGTINGSSLMHAEDSCLYRKALDSSSKSDLLAVSMHAIITNRELFI